jgi:hypothetical protein
VTEVDRTLQVLSAAENECIFRARIAPNELTGTPQDQPIAIIVQGHTGAGKTSITTLATQAILHLPQAPPAHHLFRPHPRDLRRLHRLTAAPPGRPRGQHDTGPGVRGFASSPRRRACVEGCSTRVGGDDVRSSVGYPPTQGH